MRHPGHAPAGGGMVVCPNCGHESSDRFFCDRCNALLPYAAAALPAEVALPGGGAVDCAGFGGAFPADGWRYLESARGGEPCRVYALNRGWWRDLSAAVEHRAAVALPVLAPIEVVPLDDAALVVARAL